MLPYFEQPVWHLGRISIHAFGIAVAAAVWFALVTAQRRFRGLGLDSVLGQRLGGWVILGSRC
jgi:hypothetical protein